MLKPNKPLSEPELNQLVRDLARGNVEAYSHIYRLYYPRLYRYGMQIYSRATLVEDVLQDFFTYLAENPRKVRKISNFEVYLFQSVKRNLYARLSREQQSKRSQDRYHLRTAPLHDQEVAPPDEQLIAEETATARRERLRAALAELPDHQREIIYLRYFEEMDYREICQVLDLNYQVARNYASRAIRQLKQALWNTELLLSIFMLLL